MRETRREKVIEHEQKIGRAIVAEPGTYHAKSFINSGAIGEGIKFFTEAQKEIIFTILHDMGVPNDGKLHSENSSNT